MKASELFPDKADREFVRLVIKIFDGEIIAVRDSKTGVKIFP